MSRLSQKDDLEKVLLSNNFYSSSSGISQNLSSNHLSSLRKQVNIPHSISSNLINTGLLNPNDFSMLQEEQPVQRTSFMKSSPSMKALESVLNQKTAAISPAIAEEPEDLDTVNSSSIHVTSFDDPRGSTNLLQTFQTAKLQESFHENHAVRGSISTIEETGYSTTEETPVLANPAAFARAPHRDFSPLIKLVNETSTIADDDADQLTKVSNQTNEDSSEQDDTLFENTDGDAYAKRDLLSKKPLQNTHIHAPQLPPKDANTPKNRKSMLGTETLSPGTPSFATAQRATPTLQNAARFDSPSIYASQYLASSTPKQASPHVRSNLTFSLPLSKDAQSGKHKRSSTLSDLTKIQSNTLKNVPKQPEPAKTPKKFSFKALFKLKSKNHGLNEPQPASKPSKIKSKSYSTPNLSDYSAPVPPEDKKDDKKRLFKQKKAAEPKQAEPSLLSVFKKNKSSETLSGMRIPEPQAPPPPEKAPSKAFKSNTNINFIREVTDDSYGDAYPEVVTNEYDDNYDSQNLTNNPPKKLSNDRYDQEMTLESPPHTKGPFKNDNINFGSPFAVSYHSNNNTPRIVHPSKQNTPKNEASAPVSDQLLGEALFPKSLSAHEVESIVSLERLRSMRSVRSAKRNSFANYQGGSDDNLIIDGNMLAVLQPSGSILRSGSILKNSKSRNNLNVDNFDASMNLIDANLAVEADPEVPEKEQQYNVSERDPGNANEGSSFRAASETISSYPASERNDHKAFDKAPPFHSPAVSIPAPAPVYETSQVEDYGDIMEFADFIDVDDLDFSTLPLQLTGDLQRAEILPPPIMLDPEDGKNDTLEVAEVSLSTPPASQNGPSQLSPSPAISEPKRTALEGAKLLAEAQRLLAEAQRQVLEAQRLVAEARNKEVSGYKSPSALPEEIPVVNGPLTPNLDVITNSGVSHLPGSIEEYAIETSPILETAYRTSQLPGTRNGLTANRPISMSFRGLKGPSFGGKLAMHDVRSSDSHQLFNILFGEDDVSYDEFLGLAVGEGFGSSDEDDDSFDVDEKENFPAPKPPYGSGSSAPNRQLPPPPSFGQRSSDSNNRVPLADYSNTSSPRLLSLMILKIKKSTPYSSPRPSNGYQTAPKAITIKDGVRFSSRIILFDTYNGDEYDRHPDTATCNQLTPALAQQIKEELNTLKAEMEVHETSRCYTHFF